MRIVAFEAEKASLEANSSDSIVVSPSGELSNVLVFGNVSKLKKGKK
jgi:hypothetical protein